MDGPPQPQLGFGAPSCAVPPPQQQGQQGQQGQQQQQPGGQHVTSPAGSYYQPANATTSSTMPSGYYPPQQHQQHAVPPPPPHHGAETLSAPPPATVVAPGPAVRPVRLLPKKKKIGSVDDVPLRTLTPDEETVDGRIRNREAIGRIRDAWMFQQIRQRQPEFTQYRSVSHGAVSYRAVPCRVLFFHGRGGLSGATNLESSIVCLSF